MSAVAIEVPDEAVRGAWGIYTLRDKDGRVLYIGRTSDLMQRLRSHRAAKWEWWREVRSLEWQPCTDYAEAVIAERVAIETTPESYNVSSRKDLGSRPKVKLHPIAAERIEWHYGLQQWDDLYSYAWALHRAGWKQSQIADALAVTRQAVSLWISKAAPDYDLVVPRPPAKTQGRTRKQWPTLRIDEQRRLRELQELATQCRGWHGDGHPFREASHDLTDLIVLVVARGVRRQEVADAMGVQMGTVQNRLARHGWMKKAPSLQAFGEVRHAGWEKQAACRRGHPLSGDNLRLVNSDPDRRVCRACERIRTDAYRARKSAGQEVA